MTNEIKADYMKKIILQACCAPCSTYPINRLKQDKYIPVVFFCNPNIYPFEEYEIRRKELKNYCEKLNIEYFESPYDNQEFFDFVQGLEQEPERGKRCTKCFQLRLEKTALFALEKNIKYFTTTLTVSPHKNSDVIFEVGRQIAKKYNLEFLEYNFKKQNGFKISREIAKENNMYAQNYCGCKFSISKIS